MNEKQREIDRDFLRIYVCSYLKDPYYLGREILILSERDFKRLRPLERAYLWETRDGEKRALSLKAKTYKTKEEYVLYKILAR